MTVSELSEPQLQPERIDPVKVVLNEPLALAEAQLGVELQRAAVRDLGLQNHLANKLTPSYHYRKNHVDYPAVP